MIVKEKVMKPRNESRPQGQDISVFFSFTAPEAPNHFLHDDRRLQERATRALRLSSCNLERLTMERLEKDKIKPFHL